MSTDAPALDQLLTVAEAARQTGYSEKWVRKAYVSGALRAFQTGGPGGRVRIPQSALNEWTGRPAARPSGLEGTDWSEPAPGADPNGLQVCDEYTGFISVHESRMGEFFAAKTGQR